jgi:hypothetical protein
VSLYIFGFASYLYSFQPSISHHPYHPYNFDLWMMSEWREQKIISFWRPKRSKVDERFCVKRRKIRIIEGNANFVIKKNWPIKGLCCKFFQKVLTKLFKTTGIVNYFVNSFVQEPIIYVNGIPFAPRAPDNLHANIGKHFWMVGSSLERILIVK